MQKVLVKIYRPLFLLTLCLFYAAGVYGAGGIGASAAIEPEKVRQGGITVLDVSAGPDVDSVTVLLDKKEFPLFKRDDGGFEALIGIDLEATPGSHPLKLLLKGGERVEKKSMDVEVLKHNFRVQRLKLPKKMVDLDEKTLKMVLEEKAAIEKIFGARTEKRLWQGPFLRPVDGPVSSSFGLRRILNNEPRRPHSGIDLAAPMGEPVLASNSGRVVFTGELFFSGNTVIIDHGLGLYTMYCHLSKITVEKGREVEKGAVIGLVGSTGRSTGPHLHWSVRLNGARVDPFSLIEVTGGDTKRSMARRKDKDAPGGEEESKTKAGSASFPSSAEHP